jgi:hypothetical protein
MKKNKENTIKKEVFEELIEALYESKETHEKIDELGIEADDVIAVFQHPGAIMLHYCFGPATDYIYDFIYSDDELYNICVTHEIIGEASTEYEILNR